MGADFRAFFHHTDGDFLLVFLGQLHQPTSGREACGARTNYDYVIFHRFTFH